jgi:hypothetical protein
MELNEKTKPIHDRPLGTIQGPQGINRRNQVVLASHEACI